eukprot:484950-Pyramimonas_sp.AAC.1
MPPPRHFATPLTRFVAPRRAPPEAPMGKDVCRHRAILARPSHASSPHGALNSRPRLERTYATTPSLWYTPQTLRGTIGNYAEHAQKGLCRRP